MANHRAPAPYDWSVGLAQWRTCFGASSFAVEAAAGAASVVDYTVYTGPPVAVAFFASTRSLNSNQN